MSANSQGKGEAGVRLLREGEDLLGKLAPVLRQGDVHDPEYPKALKNVIETVVKTGGWLNLPVTFESVSEGIKTSEAQQHIQSRMKWSSLKHATGWDLHVFRRSPSPILLLQQLAFAVAAVADRGKNTDAPRLEVLADLLEEAFQCVADQNQVEAYASLHSEYGIPLKGLQFSIMRVLCILYRQLLFADRSKNMKYIFRHAEAAGIMIVLANEQYAGHAEHAWNTVQKMTLGVMFITANVLEHAFQSAKHAAASAAEVGHDFAFVPAAYDLAFFITVGMAGSSFDLSEAKLLMQEIQEGEQRLERAKLKDAVLFHCPTKQYMAVLKKEWEKEDKARKAVEKKKGKAKKSKKEYLEEERLQDVKPGHIPVTDWRVFDQRFFSYYTWLEPPLQPDPQKCEQCGIQCLKVHRCDTCKLKGYCSSMCAAAHMFDHECDIAPKPWLSPPVGPRQPSPDELGEEGLFGFIPWSIVRYATLVALSYVAYYVLKAFLEFQEDHRVGVVEAIKLMFDMLWNVISYRVESILGSSSASAALDAVGQALPDVEEPPIDSSLESLQDDRPGQIHTEL